MSSPDRTAAKPRKTELGVPRELVERSAASSSREVESANDRYAIEHPHGDWHVASAATTESRPLLDLLREEYDALGMVSYTGDGNGGWIPDLRAQDIEGIMRLLMAAGSELERLRAEVADLKKRLGYPRAFR